MINKDDLTDNEKVLWLWAHETCRVFMDRLVQEEDEDLFMDMMFKASRDKVWEDLEWVLKKLPFNQNAPPKHLMKYVIFGDIMGEGVSAHDR